jgi:hypothetical protein
MQPWKKNEAVRTASQLQFAANDKSHLHQAIAIQRNLVKQRCFFADIVLPSSALDTFAACVRVAKPIEKDCYWNC